MTQAYSYPDCVFLDVEDFLNERQVFRNALHDRPSNPGSYMSYVDQPRWDACKMELIDAFGSLALRDAAEAFRGWGYLSPTFTTLAFFIEQLLETHPDHMPVDPDNVGESAT